MKKITLRIAIAVSAILLLAGSYVGYKIYDRICWFSLEDNITRAYSPIVNAIYKYQEDNGKRPNSLADIDPEYFKTTLPVKDVVISSKYTKTNKAKEWRISILVKARGITREFLYPSDGKLTEQEKKRSCARCHGWEILKVK
jgi:hypothetical protein